MSIKREKNNLTFSKKKNIMASERVAKLRKSSFAARFYIAKYPQEAASGSFCREKRRIKLRWQKVTR